MFWASIAALARTIKSAAVSLGVCSHSAQIRASTWRALSSSGRPSGAEQEIQPADAVGRNLRQLGRRLRQFLLGLGGGITRGSSCAAAATGTAVSMARRIASRRLLRAKKSRSHAGSLDAQRRAAKQRGVKDL